MVFNSKEAASTSFLTSVVLLGVTNWMKEEKGRDMHRLKNLFRPTPNPHQLFKDWQRKFLREALKTERRIQGALDTQKYLKKEIGEAVKREEFLSAKDHAGEFVSSRKTLNRLRKHKLQLTSVAMQIGETVAIARTEGMFPNCNEVMKLVDNLTRDPEVTIKVKRFRKEIIKAGLIEGKVNDVVDIVLDLENEEVETEEEEIYNILREAGAPLSEVLKREYPATRTAIGKTRAKGDKKKKGGSRVSEKGEFRHSGNLG